MRQSFWLCALLLAPALAGCQSSTVLPKGLPTTARVDEANDLAMRLDRGDWMVNRGSRIWKVMVHDAPNRPPRHIGYLQQRQYRQLRGGPEFHMYVVTTLDRNEQVGHIDQLGQAVRYEPRRNGTFAKVSAGTNTRERNVAAIFDTKARVTLVEASERRLAFEALDVNGDGRLDANETRSFGDRVASADANGDGVVDFEEFDAVDVL